MPLSTDVRVTMEKDPDTVSKELSHSGETAGPKAPLANTFIGYTSPESVLRSTSPSRSQAPRDSHVGVWIEPPQHGQSTVEDVDDEGRDASSVRSTEWPIGRDRSDKIAASSCQSRDVRPRSFTLPKAIIDSLIDVYFSRIHPLIPMLHQSPSVLKMRPGTSLLVQGICLAACKDESIDSVLFVPGVFSPLSPRKVSSRLYSSIKSELETRDVDDIEWIQILALLSLHSEGVRGLEQSSLYLMRAIHHAQSLGLHINSPRRCLMDGESGAKLFWCLWSLDKLNAALGGRPIFISDQDIGIPWVLRTSPSSVFKTEKYSAFRSWMSISKMLSEAISYYRPIEVPNHTGWEHEFPPFEDVVGADADKHIEPPLMSECRDSVTASLGAYSGHRYA